MWIPKGLRDVKKGVDSPMPTQVVSNEEFIPRRQTTRQKHVEHLIGELGDERAKKLGLSRRTFMASSMGLATCFLASNKVYGNVWEVDEAETWEPAAYDEKWPKSEYFIMDVQSHFTNGAGIGGKVLPSWVMWEGRKQINELAGSQRAVNQGNLAPNHYWDKVGNKIDKAACIEQMEREIKLYGISSWKWYCHTDPGQSGNGFQLDDDNSQWFIEESRKRGIKLISTHKGYSYQSRTLGHLANPKDVEKAALRNPDFNFVVYHSAIKHGQQEQGMPPNANWLDKDHNNYDPTTGDFEWHRILMDIKKRNPQMNNVYCEIGSFFNTLAVWDPVLCQHGLGKNIKYYGSDHVIWGTDCLWWGSPQWGIDALKRFQISDEMCEKFGYKKVTKEDKAKIFGLNAARLYNVDVKAKRKALTADALEQMKIAYVEGGGERSNAAYGWVRSDD